MTAAAPSAWTTLDKLGPGDLFVTSGGVRALVLDEARQSNLVAIACLGSGHCAHWPPDMPVMEIAVAGARQPPGSCPACDAGVRYSAPCPQCLQPVPAICAACNGSGQVVHGRGYPGLGPPTLCGVGGAVPGPGGAVTCPGCLDLLVSPERLADRANQLESASRALTPLDPANDTTGEPA